MSWNKTMVCSLTLAAILAGCGMPNQVSAPSENTGTENQVSAPVEPGYELTDEMALETYAERSGEVYSEEDFNTEEYGVVKEAGFISVATSPLSTVSADVDTASYANVRRMLIDGMKVAPAGQSSSDEYDSMYGYGGSSDTIPAGAVRIEEMINYFDYDYAPPSGDQAFNIVSEVAACPWNKDTYLLSLGFQTAPEDASVKEAGRNLVFLIDISGSMDDPDKLPLLQNAFSELVADLTERDVVSIVTYAGGEDVLLDGASGKDGRTIMRAIRSLKADGSTNGEAGLKMAYDIANKHFIKGGVNRIIMASDGDLNVGISSESDLHDFVEKKREGGIYLSVLGFGAGNYKDNKMETLADDGNGSYHYIDSEAEAKRVFADRICQNLVPFANDTKLQVEFNPAKISAYRLIGYENRTMAAEDFKNDAADAGEVGPSSQFTVLYELMPAGAADTPEVKGLKYSKTTYDEGVPDLLTATLRYKSVADGSVKELEHVVGEGDIKETGDEDFKMQAALAEFGMILRGSDYQGTSSYDSIRELVGSPGDELKEEFLTLVDLAERN